MERLGYRDYRSVLNCLSGLYMSADADEFPQRAVFCLHSLITCDLVTYDEMDPERHSSADHAWPPEGFPLDVQLRWKNVMPEHPVLMHCQRTADLHAYRISDFYSQNRYERLALYHEYYRKIDIADALCKGINISGPVVIGCAFHRARRTFTQKHCLVFDLVGPHLTQAWRNARAMSNFRNQMGAGVDAADCGLITLAPGGRPKLVTPRAQTLLAEFFGDGTAGDHRIPPSIASWVRAHKHDFREGNIPDPLTPLIIKDGESRLVVRLLPGAEQDVLLLQAQRPARELVCAHDMGLTQRELEILTWVAKGKTNKEIGVILRASPRTVQKHLEHIFLKLGVETRTAAAAALATDSRLRETDRCSG